MIKNEDDRLTRVIVCSPANEYFHVTALSEHNITRVSDSVKALSQHEKLRCILTNTGCEVIDVPELKGHPNSIFTRDTAVCTPKGYIKLRMGLPARMGEEEWMAEILDKLEVPCIGKIEAPGTVEGGDVIIAGNVAFIGHSQRTNNSGVEQLSCILHALQYEIRSIEVPPPYLHLGGAMSMIAPNKVLCCKDLFPEDFFWGFERIEVPKNNFISGNVIRTEDNKVIADLENGETIKVLEQAGCMVQGIDLSEFIKGTGGPSCLIMPVERISLIHLY